MTDTIKRFENGVHTKDDCGKNKHGYAAMGALFELEDVHRLGRTMSSPSESVVLHPKKKTFAYSDILAYIFMKVLVHKGMHGVYVLFLSSGSFLSPTIQDIISSLSEMMGLVIVVQHIGKEFVVTKTFADSKSSQVYTNEASLIEFFSLIGGMEDAFAIVHPVVNPVYRSVISQCKINNWCVPSSRSEIYISKSPGGRHFHNVFPWSRHPCYSGFTIGRGEMEIGSASERYKYIGAFNSYESMVSSVPLNNLCTDCAALKRIAKFIQLLTGKTPTRHRHTMSESSIKALEEAKEYIKKMLQESTK